jgi:hypothetical protein
MGRGVMEEGMPTSSRLYKSSSKRRGLQEEYTDDCKSRWSQRWGGAKDVTVAKELVQIFGSFGDKYD